MPAIRKRIYSHVGGCWGIWAARVVLCLAIVIWKRKKRCSLVRSSGESIKERREEEEGEGRRRTGGVGQSFEAGNFLICFFFFFNSWMLIIIFGN